MKDLFDSAHHLTTVRPLGIVWFSLSDIFCDKILSIAFLQVYQPETRIG